MREGILAFLWIMLSWVGLGGIETCLMMLPDRRGLRWPPPYTGSLGDGEEAKDE